MGGDLLGAGASGRGAEKPKPFDLGEYSAQIRNDVREQYRRVYGLDPSDGEVQTWTDYIVSTGMDMQRRNIRKYDSPDTAGAAAEAEERFIERLEGSPGAMFLRDSNEETPGCGRPSIGWPRSPQASQASGYSHPTPSLSYPSSPYTSESVT